MCDHRVYICGPCVWPKKGVAKKIIVVVQFLSILVDIMRSVFYEEVADTIVSLTRC